MSGEAVRKAWVVAASIGTVEALKDQGVARWNRPIDQIARTKILSSYCNVGVDGSSRSVFMGAGCCLGSWVGECRVKRRNEESMDMVMEVSCFGPNSVRF
ncbi:hypothetical protein R6Q57_006482 [Mikania cordata]